MVLANNETLIKEWNYASSKAGGLFNKVETKAKIEVTSRRLIYTASNKNATDRQEVPLKEINGLSFKQTSKGNIGAIIKIVFGILFAVVIVGIPLLIMGIKELNQGSFEMEVTTRGQSTSALTVGVSKILKAAKSKGNVKININKDIVGEIIETLGSVIVENTEA